MPTFLHPSTINPSILTHTYTIFWGRHLSKDVYDMTVLNLSPVPEGGSDTFAREVRVLGIPLIIGKTSPISISDLEVR